MFSCKVIVAEYSSMTCLLSFDSKHMDLQHALANERLFRLEVSCSLFDSSQVEL